MTVAFIANLIQSSGMNQTMFCVSLLAHLERKKKTKKNTYPNPNNTNPATTNTLDLRKAPITIRSNNRADQLGNAECNHERRTGPFHEEEAVRTSDEDQRLRDDSDLEVDDHVQHRVVRGGHLGVESHAKLVLEEGGFHDDDDEGDAVSKLGLALPK